MPHQHVLRVRYAETDAQGVAHHASYVAWLEEARIEYLRDLGRSYRDLEAEGLLLPVTEVQVRYRRPLRFDDRFVIQTAVRLAGPSRLAFDSRLVMADAIHAEASVTVVAVDADLRPRRLPDDLLGLIGGREPDPS